MWQELIGDMRRAGLKEAEIVTRLKAMGVETTQPTINRIMNGKIGEPNYQLGAAIVKLHSEVCKPKRRNGKQSEARA